MLNTTNAHPKSVSLAAFVNDGSFICVVVSRRTENVRLLCYVLWCEDTNNLPIHQIFLFISSFLLSIQLISLPLQTTILITPAPCIDFGRCRGILLLPSFIRSFCKFVFPQLAALSGTTVNNFHILSFMSYTCSLGIATI